MTLAAPITSRANPTYKALLRQLARAGKDGVAALDGVHVCQAWLQAKGAPVHAVFDAERINKPELAALLAAVLASAPATGITLLAPHLLKSLASVPADQGVLFMVEPPAPVLPTRLTETTVWLDAVQDPGNVGTILRTCAAVGIARVLLGIGTAAAWSPKVLRSAQGAHFALDIHERLDLPACLERLDVPLVTTTLDASHTLFDAPLPTHCAWVFGHEGRGIATALVQAAALHLRIDHSTVVESLNVGVAAALCLFEQHRRGIKCSPRP